MIDNALKDAEAFAAEFTETLSDPETSTASKQVYFMDNHYRIQSTMATLNKVISYVSSIVASAPGDATEENKTQLSKAKAVLAIIKDAITNFQSLLSINENVKEEDLPSVALTPQTIMGAVQEENTHYASPIDTLYTHALITDGEVHYFCAKTKAQVDTTINEIVGEQDFDEVSLYALSPVSLPLKKKIIFTM